MLKNPRDNPNLPCDASCDGLIIVQPRVDRNLICDAAYHHVMAVNPPDNLILANNNFFILIIHIMG